MAFRLQKWELETKEGHNWLRTHDNLVLAQDLIHTTLKQAENVSERRKATESELPVSDGIFGAKGVREMIIKVRTRTYDRKGREKRAIRQRHRGCKWRNARQ